MNKTKTIAVTGIFSALTVLLTLIHMPLPGGTGYIHFGDGIIYLASCILPAPYSVFAAAIGGALADLLSGFGVWAPFTFVIKALNTVPFIIAYKYMKKDRIISKPTVTAAVISSILTVGLYCVASGVLYGNFAAAAAEIPGSIIQATGSFVIFFLVGMAPGFSNIKQRLDRR